MFCIHSWSRFHLDLWPLDQIYRFLWRLRVLPITSVCFDIGIPYLAHVSITMSACVTFIHDPDRTCIFDLKVQFIRCMTWFCVRTTAFLSFDIVILWLARECITMVQCVAYIPDRCMTLTFDLNIKICIFTIFKSGKIVFALWHRHTKICYMGVLPWDNMSCTFLTLVWPWHLT